MMIMMLMMMLAPELEYRTSYVTSSQADDVVGGAFVGRNRACRVIGPLVTGWRWIPSY